MLDRLTRKLTLEPLEARHVLTVTLGELAAIGVDQETVDLIGNVNGDFIGDIGPNNPGSPDVSYSPLVLNEPTLRNVVDAVAATKTPPANATVLTNEASFAQITAGTPGNPNIYLIQGDITLTGTNTIVVPSNVDIYVDGSIFKAGQFTNDMANSGNNADDSIFDINGTDNIRLIGVNNALLHSTPSFQPTDPHTSGVIITGSADNVTVEGFDMQFFWNAVNAQFGTTNITVSDNVIRDSVNRSVWFLGASNSTTVHNFISNAGLDTIDYDAFTADSVAYENVLIGAGRFTYFVEEGANNNFSVRQLSIMHRYSETTRPNGFQLGNASNGTSPEFVAGPDGNGRPGEFTRDNFFIDNVTYAPSTQQFRGDFIATGDNGVVGISYFYGNRGFGADNGDEVPRSGRDVSARAIYEDRLPNREILAANDVRFDSLTGFNTYDLRDVLNGFIAEYNGPQSNTTPHPIRPEILPLTVAPRTVYLETGGQVVFEAENYTSQALATGVAEGKFWGLLSDDDQGGTQTDLGDSAVGTLGVIVDRNTGVNTGDTLVGPRLDYEIDFQTPGIYNVHIRMRASAIVDDSIPTTNDSVHVGLNGQAVTFGGFGLTAPVGEQWGFVNDVSGAGPQDITVTVTEAGRHTFNIWGREDGAEIDRIVLTTSGTAPIGFGPAESPILQTSPVIGDYDLDLNVDTDDYQIWSASFGSSNTPWSEGSGNGVVDAADYVLWRDRPGVTAAVDATSKIAAAEVTEALAEPTIVPPLAATRLQPSLASKTKFLAPISQAVLAQAVPDTASDLALLQHLADGSAWDGHDAPSEARSDLPTQEQAADEVVEPLSIQVMGLHE